MTIFLSLPSILFSSLYFVALSGFITFAVYFQKFKPYFLKKLFLLSRASVAARRKASTKS
jgi:hypothetical protein